MTLSRFFSRWVLVYRQEIRLFLWFAALYFLIRSSNVVFNNYAETVFLKRFGVEYLPLVYMVNAVTTLLIMSFMASALARLPGQRLLVYALFTSGSTVFALSFLIGRQVPLLYPVLHVLKSQYEIMLGLMFWHMANDAFDTRQSKRIFPLITGAGVLGGILASFASPLLARGLSIDGLTYVYATGAFLGMTAAVKTKSYLPESSTLQGRRGDNLSLIEQWRSIVPILKASKLARFLVLLTLIPNLAVPIINYQFNVTVDMRFPDEASMIGFFGRFRGLLNCVSLAVLLFAGQVHSRWGLPVALLFHPLNYFLAFGAFLLRFDVSAAMYAKISITALRTAINRPARLALFGLVEGAERPPLRAFLRGPVVRAGLLIGSSAVAFAEGLVHTRSLSFLGMGLVSLWVGSVLYFKSKYPHILMELLSRRDPGPPFSKSRAGMAIDEKERKRFLQELNHVYSLMVYASALRRLDATVERDLLIRHLVEKKHSGVETIMSDLAARDQSGNMRMIRRAIGGPDPRRRSNGIEAFESYLRSPLARLITAVLEDMPASRALRTARKDFGLHLKRVSPRAVLAHLVKSGDSVSVVLALSVAAVYPLDEEGVSRIRSIVYTSPAANVRRTAETALRAQESGSFAVPLDQRPPGYAPLALASLTASRIFGGAAVGELGALSLAGGQRSFLEGEPIFTGGGRTAQVPLLVSAEPVRLAYLEGRDALDEGLGFLNERVLDRLFSDEGPQTDTATAPRACSALIFHKEELFTALRSHPGLALSICRRFARQLLDASRLPVQESTRTEPLILSDF